MDQKPTLLDPLPSTLRLEHDSMRPERVICSHMNFPSGW
jgi:hypothetical protein